MVAHVFYRKTIDQTRDSLDSRAAELGSRVDEATTAITAAIVIVGSVSVLALIIALAAHRER